MAASPKLSPAACEALYLKAYEAGAAAAAASVPTPMVVSEHANPLNDASPVKRSWFVSDGVCGFAWVKVRPGNSSFANWLKKNGKGRPDYPSGVAINISAYNQSMERKEAHARAMAKVLSEAGITAYADSRMD